MTIRANPFHLQPEFQFDPLSVFYLACGVAALLFLGFLAFDAFRRKRKPRDQFRK